MPELTTQDWGPTPVSFDPTEAWDNMHGLSPAGVHWSRDNVGEAVPGVACPLGAAIWSRISERTTRGAFAAIGALSAAEARPPDRLEDQVVRIFCGRIALQVELMTLLGDRLPGTSGRDIAASLLGTVPADITYRPTRRRYPIIAFKLGRTFLSMPSQLRAVPPQVHAWWQRSLIELRSAELAAAKAKFEEALVQFERALLLQTISVIGSAQLVHEALAQLVARAGTGDIAILSGTGGAEMAVVADVWRASRGELSIQGVLANHGFHGPFEGELSSVVWREDPAPLERMIGEYARLSDDADPRLREHRLHATRAEQQRQLLAALPRRQRPGAKFVLHLAETRLPLRGVAKRSFLQGIDILRASARRIGSELARSGAIADLEDVFYLTLEELTGQLPDDVRQLVPRRRERRLAYQQVELPGSWTGQVVPVSRGLQGPGTDRPTEIAGVGVSAGVVEGSVRVVTDPSFEEVEPGEILVAPTTDPSWASIMFLSAGLVVDIGGPLSHAAVVARELGLPCVVNTRSGTQHLRTGDVVRVDGDAGTVQILHAASDA